MSSIGYPRLVADLGGSNARFGWIGSAAGTVTQVRKLPVPAYPGLVEASNAYLADLQATLGDEYRPPRHAAIAVATAVTGDHIAFTNSHWAFSRRSVQAALGFENLLLLNDFESLALSLPLLGPAQLRADSNRPSRRPGLLAVVGPGTGLGVGAVAPTAHGWMVIPGEGGHATLAPADELEDELIGIVRRKFSHVSAERLLSGTGMPTLHQALGQALRVPLAEPLTTAEIVERGVARSDELCSRTIDMFCALLGGVAGSVALTLGATGGVFIGGGIVPRFADRFFASDFRARFEAKGRCRPYLEAIPTSLITDTLAALTGAALALELIEINPSIEG